MIMHQDFFNKVILGTAKIGISDYGFSSSSSYLSCFELFRNAAESGVSTLDTSPRYGNAEEIIGEFHGESDNTFLISTKIDDLVPNDAGSEDKIFRSVERSIARTKVSAIECVYLHQNDIEIISDKKILSALSKLKNRGMVKKTGTSIYSYEECEFSLTCDVYDVIQIPLSIMDSHIYSKLVDNYSLISKEIIARSIFLQGTLLNRNDIWNKVKQAGAMTDYLSQLDSLIETYGIDMLSLACSFVLSLKNVSSFIVGTASQENLANIIKASQLSLSDELIGKVKKLSDEYKVWGNPRNW